MKIYSQRNIYKQNNLFAKRKFISNKKIYLQRNILNKIQPRTNYLYGLQAVEHIKNMVVYCQLECIVFGYVYDRSIQRFDKYSPAHEIEYIGQENYITKDAKPKARVVGERIEAATGVALVYDDAKLMEDCYAASKILQRYAKLANRALKR